MAKNEREKLKIHSAKIDKLSLKKLIRKSIQVTIKIMEKASRGRR
tara:strand:+ start:405 stop:539 length:135 start_codon:yes stop_codon:yes gene_type:complete